MTMVGTMSPSPNYVTCHVSVPNLKIQYLELSLKLVPNSAFKMYLTLSELTQSAERAIVIQLLESRSCVGFSGEN
jgi:hypothetical protein